MDIHGDDARTTPAIVATVRRICMIKVQIIIAENRCNL